MKDAVVACDDDDHVIYLNPAAESRYGTSASAALGRTWTDLFEVRWPNARRPAEGRRRARATNGVCRRDTLQLTRAGARIHVETTMSRLKRCDGAPTGRLTVSRDVTER